MSSISSLLLLFITCLCVKVDTFSRFPVGALFNHETNSRSEEVFRVLSSLDTSKPFQGRILHPNVINSLSVSQELCSDTSENKGIVALIDVRPTNGICDITCLLCNKLHISHLSVAWEIPDTSDQDEFSFFYHPPSELISKAYATLIKELEWDRFTFFYEDDGSFVRLQEVINSWPYNNERIQFEKLEPDGDNRKTFKNVFGVLRISYHLIDCDVNNIQKYMKEIVSVNNSTQYQSFILTALDSYLIKLDDISQLRANVSTLHLTKSNEPIWRDFGIDTAEMPVLIETALTADALNHFEKAIRTMRQENMMEYVDPPEICFAENKAAYKEKAWIHGEALKEVLLQTTFRGTTGNITFDENGKRTNFTLYYSKLDKESQFVHVGTWDSKTDSFLTINNAVTDRSKAITSDSVVRVAMKVGMPYFDVEEANGTIIQKGYAVDLIDAIFKHIRQQKGYGDIKHEIYKTNANSAGNPIAGTKKWDGLIGEVLELNAEMAISDITITSERSAVVEFSMPFMSLGISMLVRERDPQQPDMFSFIKPLALDVWLYLATAYIIVSFVLLICARMSQGDWVNPHPCNQHPENLQNIWSLYNCMWLTVGAIMTQGCDILPRAAGSRWVTGMWWFFALIVTASYTANMSTFLSNSRRDNEIKDVKELSEQNEVSYGVLINGSTYNFFENSNDSVYQKIWTVMKSAKPTVFTNNNDEGRDRVVRSKGNYVFFMESTAIEYYMQRNCDLKMVGSKLDSKDYGIALHKNSPYKRLVDNAILALQETGDLLSLKKKWWESDVKEGNCEKSTNEAEDNGSLQMKNTSGIFLVLGFGGILGFFVAIIDFLLHARQISVKEKVTFKEALLSEWRASLDPRVLHKPAAPPRSAPPSVTPSPRRERSQSRAVSVLRAATSFINFDEIY
ncbi:PREDICTED: glutamate receptor ionotropic, kainate 2-like [Papilio xuthus]|uniref:Glutamate receptor ionotropic, kainate 2-like n=1 Tax=Papilio xuthus TaxID=66420 RepID=A0AAJ6ZJ10_PAPXU|nr:PREDICTED: glutamate receptor ionotropic, kainate 2-like [Papilio xuthus]